LGRFDKGITKYTVCNLDINVSFPEDEVKCKYCMFLRHYDTIDRDICHITNETLYSRELTGLRCPLTILNQVDTEDLKDETNL